MITTCNYAMLCAYNQPLIYTLTIDNGQQPFRMKYNVRSDNLENFIPPWNGVDVEWATKIVFFPHEYRNRIILLPGTCRITLIGISHHLCLAMWTRPKLSGITSQKLESRHRNLSASDFALSRTMGNHRIIMNGDSAGMIEIEPSFLFQSIAVRYAHTASAVRH